MEGNKKVAENHFLFCTLNLSSYNILLFGFIKMRVAIHFLQNCGYFVVIYPIDKLKN